ncbi:hypothetical protein MMC07_009248 [Pseudocyphellaria aurata]|nr:hypothetical protein [Pseudocyphellaria aurata]
MQLSNLLLPLALIANAVFAAPTPAVLEKRTLVFYFTYSGLGYGQPPNFSPATYPTYCDIPQKDSKIYIPAGDTRQTCGSFALLNTDPNATVA